MDLQERRKKASDYSLGSSNERIYQRALELVQKNAKGGSMADFGSGRGEFVSRVFNLDIFSQCTGIDLMERPTELTPEVQWESADLNNKTQFSDDSFDFITALEVIEHLENPRHTLRELFRLLKSGGMALLSTPNNESYRSLISYFFRGHFVDFTDRSYPAHITPLNRKDLQRAATEAGFQVKGFSFTNHGCVPGMTKASWQQLSFGAARGLRFSDNFYVLLTKP